MRRVTLRLILGGFGIWAGTILQFSDSKSARALDLDLDLAREAPKEFLLVIAPYLDTTTAAARANPVAFDQHCRRIMRETAETLMRVESMA